MKRVLILGGYGNFGTIITKTLASEPNITVIVAGRSAVKARQLAKQYNTEWVAVDIHQSLDVTLKDAQADIVIHTAGPFQNQDYQVAKSCIRNGCHYIDLADARNFVAGINQLDDAARDANVLIISGASSVPCLSSAIINAYQHQFQSLESIDYAITTAHQTYRGLATTLAVLGYAGKPFSALIDGQMQTIYGWQDLHAHKFSNLGWRLLSNCDIPDLELFPQYYPSLKTIRFYAGLASSLEQIGIWLMSWLVRYNLLPSLDKLAKPLLKISYLYRRLGGKSSAFYMTLAGKDWAGSAKSITFELTAHDNYGPYIPCMPACILAKKIAAGDITKSGAQPCIGIITLEEYMDSLKGYPIYSKD